MAMILPGMDVVNQLRSHISFEQELLDRIVGSRRPQKRELGNKKTATRSKEKKRRHTAKHRSHRGAAHTLSYTLEPHPEL
jgi:hypothetical protein